MNWEKLFISRLLIAIPEIAFDEKILEYAIKLGVVTQKQIDEVNFWKGQLARAGRIEGKLSSRSFTQRLMILAPELLSVNSVNLLRKFDVISEQDGHKLRLVIRSLRATGVVPGAIPSNATFAARLRGLAGTLLSNEVIDLWRTYPLLGMTITKEEADRLRGVLLLSNRMSAIAKAFKAGDGILDSAFLVFPEIFDKDMVRAAVLTGAISQENARTLLSVIKLGNTAWRTGTKVWRAKSFEQRALLTSMGVFSDDMIDFLRTIGVIDRGTARFLSTSAQIARTLAKTRLDALTAVARRYRVVPGEAPIKTFANASRTSERDLIALLRDAARATEQDIEKLATKDNFSSKTRSAQQQILRSSIFTEMRALWEGVGYLTIAGEKSAAKAAVDSMDYIAARVFSAAGSEADLLRRQLREQGRAGIDSLISREENIKPLSARVYRNFLLTEDLVTRRIQIGLIRGLSAKELADSVADLIRPDVRGGVSYAAMRLARTEINNAFHLTSIRYTREMPWVNAYKWHLSGSHPKRDVCNTMAERDHAGLGPGVYRKRDVPNKPHPQCFCYITPQVMPQDEFLRQYRRGVFNQYIATRTRAGLYAQEVDDPVSRDIGSRLGLRLPSTR